MERLWLFFFAIGMKWFHDGWLCGLEVDLVVFYCTDEGEVGETGPLETFDIESDCSRLYRITEPQT